MTLWPAMSTRATLRVHLDKTGAAGVEGSSQSKNAGNVAKVPQWGLHLSIRTATCLPSDDDYITESKGELGGGEKQRTKGAINYYSGLSQRSLLALCRGHGCQPSNIYRHRLLLY